MQFKFISFSYTERLIIKFYHSSWIIIIMYFLKNLYHVTTLSIIY